MGFIQRLACSVSAEPLQREADDLRATADKMFARCCFYGFVQSFIDSYKSHSTLASLSLVLLLCSHFSVHCLNRFGCDKMMKHSAILLYTHTPQYFQAAVPVIVERLIF